MNKNKAVHKGNGLLPYPVIVSATQGDIMAMGIVLNHYEHYIARLSMRTVYDDNGYPHTRVDEDMRSRLETKLISSSLINNTCSGRKPHIPPFLRLLSGTALVNLSKFISQQIGFDRLISRYVL